jgi:hypothetical protein
MARPDFPRSLAEFQGRFATQADCRRYLVACRWPHGFRCPRCGAREAYEVAERAPTTHKMLCAAESTG